MNTHPNIVLFMASDLGYGDVGCYGNRAHRTPNIDRLAAGGVRFTDFHSNGCMCSPSRAALLTGLYQQRVGLENVLNHATRSLPGMADDAYTYGHAFSDAGYATGFFGVCHSGYLPEQSPLTRGFDEFVGLCGGMDHHSHVTRWGKPNWWRGDEQVDESGYSTDIIMNNALNFIDRHHNGPFCLHVADFLVHFPYQGPDDPPVFLEGQTYDEPDLKYGRRTDQHAAYAEMVEAMDHSVGRLVDKLEALGLLENTLFLFTTDHGGHHLVANNGPLNGAKGSLYEGGHRIPTIAHWSGHLKAGRVVNDTAMLMDLFPTFIELCELQPPSAVPFDGVSLCHLLLQGASLSERTLFWRMGEQKAARRGPWKLVVTPENGVQLFNLDEDVGEAHDVAAQEQKVYDLLVAEQSDWEFGTPPAPLPTNGGRL